MDGLPPLEHFDAIVLGGPVYAAHHPKMLKRFVEEFRGELDLLPTVFFSVTVREARSRSRSARVAREHMGRFFAETRWRPNCCRSVSGLLPYSRMEWITRLIARKLLRHNDTRDDCIHTDWNDVQSFVRFVDLISVLAKDHP